MAAPNMGGYVEVAERIRDFRDKHPEGSLRPMDPAKPYWLETIDGHTYLVYAAAAYRHPEDPMPGVGLAWEPVPGTTSFTRGSELQNAETSAWGRAIVAVLASDTKRGVASQDEVRSAQERQRSRPVQASEAPAPADPRIAQIIEQVKQLDTVTRERFKTEFGEKPSAIKDPAAALAWLSAETEPF